MYLGYARQALKCLPPKAAPWVERIICESYEVAKEQPPSLEDVGRSYMGYATGKMARAAGACIIKISLEQVYAHYRKCRVLG
jgi:hypothetical protein